MSNNGTYSTQKDVEQFTQQQFAFLLDKPGFVRGPTERDAVTTGFYYKYQANGIGLGVSLDFHDMTVDFYLVMLQGGRVPPNGGFVPAVAGQSLRRDIPTFLRDDQHIQDDHLDTLFALYGTPHLRSYQFLAELVQTGREVIELYINLILQQPLEVLFPPRTRRSPPTT